MKKSAIIAVTILIALIGVVVIAAPGMDGDNSPSSSAPETTSNTNEVIIDDFDFQTPVITVKVGTTVTWTNRDSAQHDINPIEKSENFKASELLSQGESYSFTFNTPGTFEYNCSPHPYMKAKVVVSE